MNTNKYGSLTNLFIGADMYNLALPVTPPADLSLTVASMAPAYLFYREGTNSQVVGFRPADNPYIRGIAMVSNLADGLVDKATAHFGDAVPSWHLRYTPQRFGAALTGTITNVAGSATVSGGSAFTKETAKGMTLVWLDDNGCVRSGVISSITNDNTLVLTAVTASGTGMLTANTTTKSAYPLVGVAGYAGPTVTIPFLVLNQMNDYAFFLFTPSLIYTPTGKITVTAGSTAMVGVGTTFVTDYTVGSVIGWLDDAGVTRRGVVSAIADQTHLTLTANAYANATQQTILNLDHHLRIMVDMTGTFQAYTISLDPAYAGKRFALSTQVLIEHTFGLSEAIY